MQDPTKQEDFSKSCLNFAEVCFVYSPNTTICEGAHQASIFNMIPLHFYAEE